MELSADAYDHIPMKPYAREYLDKCRACGERMALFTACVPEFCRAAMKHHGLEPYFETVIFAQELGVDKKSPEIFLKVADMLDEVPENCTLYDDSLTACKGAKAAGMKVIGVYDEAFRDAQTEMHRVCDRYIEGFEELL